MGHSRTSAPGTSRLVERQARRSQIEERRVAPTPPPGNVALSRLPRSDAAPLGQAVATQLGFGFYGIALIDEIARSQGVQRELVDDLDEHVRSLVDRFVIDSFRSRPFQESQYVRGLVRTVAALGQRGRAVILGRGSACILPATRALRVLVVAPERQRVERLAEQEGLERSAAARQLAREDEQRRSFLRHHFRIDPDDPVHYDLVVNTATLGTGPAADLVVSALRQRFGARQYTTLGVETSPPAGPG